VVPGGIGHLYDKEHSYPMPNADIGMILGEWILDAGWKDDRMTGKPALAKFSSTTKVAMIDSSIAEWIAERVSGNIQMVCPAAKKIGDNFVPSYLRTLAQIRPDFHCKISIYFTWRWAPRTL
jgi:hypothetical protein